MAFLKRFLSENLHNSSLFRTVYIINLFFCSVCFWNVVGIAVNVLIFFWSLVLLVDMFWIRKNFHRVKHLAVLFFFLAAGLYTALLHIESNFAVNFVMIYHAAICFFLFYGMYSEHDGTKLRAEIDRILKLIAYLSTFMAIIGLLFELIAPTGRLYLGDYVFGIMDNRFTGAYTNPNLAAFSSVAGMACCHILIKRNPSTMNGKRVIPIWAAILCFLTNTISLLLSDSNSSLIFAVIYICVYAFFRFYQKSAGSFSKKIILSVTALILCCGFIVGCGLGLRSVGQTAVSELINATDQVRVMAETGEKSSNVQAKNEVKNTSIGRTDSYDLSSGRLDSLKKSMGLFVKFPLFGIGKGNIVPYGEKYLINSFSFHDLHNGYLTILISDGIVGLVAFSAFMLLLAKNLFRFLRRNRNTDLKEFPALIAALAAYCVFGLFEKAVLFDITFMVMAFWMLMGHTALFISEYEWQEDMAVDNRAAIPVSGYIRPGYTYVYPAYPSEAESNFHSLESGLPVSSKRSAKLYYEQGLSPPHSVETVEVRRDILTKKRLLKSKTSILK